MAIRIDQIDTVASEFEGAGTDLRQLSIKVAGVNETKLGFAWATVKVLASAFTFGSPRSTFTLATAASSNTNVLDNAELLRNGAVGQDRVTTTSAEGEWSLSGTTLSVHGDVTASADTYTLRYVIGSASGAAFASGNLTGATFASGSHALAPGEQLILYTGTGVGTDAVTLPVATGSGRPVTISVTGAAPDLDLTPDGSDTILGETGTSALVMSAQHATLTLIDAALGAWIVA